MNLYEMVFFMVVARRTQVPYDMSGLSENERRAERPNASMFKGACMNKTTDTHTHSVWGKLVQCLAFPAVRDQ